MSSSSLVKNILLIILFIVLMYFVFQSFVKKDETLSDIKNNITASIEDNVNIKDMQNSKVDIEILKEGEGEVSKNGDNLVVHYTGTFENGQKFDSSLDRGTPFEFTLGNHSVIEGWEQGMLGMKIGEKRKMFIPYELGYGEGGYGPIPAKSNLIFEVELLEIK